MTERLTQGLFLSSSKAYVEKAMAPHSSTLAWKILWMEDPGRLQSMGSLSVGHDWATSLTRIGEGNGNRLQCSCLENPRDRGAWWASISGVAQSQTRWRDLAAAAATARHILWSLYSSANFPPLLMCLFLFIYLWSQASGLCIHRGISTLAIGNKNCFSPECFSPE